LAGPRRAPRSRRPSARPTSTRCSACRGTSSARSRAATTCARAWGSSRPVRALARRFSVVDSEPAITGAEKDLFDGIDTSLARIAAFAKGQESKVATLASSLAAIDADAKAAGAAFDIRAPHKTLPALAAGLTKLRALRDAVKASTLTADARDEILYRLDRVGDFERAVPRGAGGHVTVNDGNVIRGQYFEVTAAVRTGAEPVVDDVRVNVPGGWTAPGSAPKSLRVPGATLTCVWSARSTLLQSLVLIRRDHTARLSISCLEPARRDGRRRYTTGVTRR
jgi:hypothetical protein